VYVGFDSGARTRILVEHGLDLADAPLLLDGPTLTLEDDRFDRPEPRYQTYGYLADGLVLMAWAPAEAGVRVISMRPCHDPEIRRVAPRLA
jgi:uncharacterized DUF497 family protein